MNKKWILSLICFGAIVTVGFAETLIVGNKYAGTVSFIDLETGKEIMQPETGGSPHEIALSPDGKRAVVVSYMEEGYIGKELNVFDMATGKLIKTIDISPHMAPHGIEWIGDTSLVIVTAEETRDVVFVDVDAGKVVAAPKTNQIGSHLLALSPDAKTAYVTNRGSDNMSIVDIENMKVVKTVPTGKEPEGVYVSPDGKELWVANRVSHDIQIFDTATLKEKDRIETGYLPIRVRFAPDGKQVAVADLEGHRILVFDAATRKKVAAIDTAEVEAERPCSLYFAPDGKALYAGTEKGSKVIEIDTSTWKVARSFPAGDGADGMQISPVKLQPKS